MRIGDLETLTTFHDKLNPDLWENNRLKPQVRLALFKIAKAFVEFINVEDLELTDITISGSNASFNYNNKSDIDLHLIANSNGPCKVNLKDLFQAKKVIFNDQHDITILGHAVEVYVQGSEDAHISNGVYSVYDDNWVAFPKKITAKPDITNIEHKFEHLEEEIKQALESGDPQTIARLKKRIKDMRQSGLEKNGEFGVENLAFKLLRNTGLIQKLYDAETIETDKELSLGQQGVAEGLSESRNSLFAFVKQQFPTWPDYVLKDFLYQQAKGIRDQAELDDFLKRNKQDFGNCKWTLTKLPITVDIFTPKTQRMLASREGGSSNPFQVPRDAERHAQQSQMIQQKGVSAEPIIVAKLSNGYDLIEGWHRTIQHLKAFPQGYTGPAWVCTGATYKSESVEQGVAEGFSNDMSTEDMIAYLRQHHDTNLHQDYLDHINTFSKFVLQNIPVNSIKTDLPALDRAKVEQYKQMDFSKAPPIVIGGGYILDGYHRANVAKALGIPTIKAYVGVQGQQGVAEGNAFLGALNTARKNNLEYFIVDGKKYKVKKNKKIVKEEELTEKWSKKYKRSIDCSHPKGFSQKAHCAGRKKK